MTTRPRPGRHAEHLLGVVLSELAGRRPDGEYRLLDVGCGDGALLAYFGHRLPESPRTRPPSYGSTCAISACRRPPSWPTRWNRWPRRIADVQWGARVSSIANANPWPYAADSFDVVVSNQVLEHVPRSRAGFAETAVS